MHDQKKQMNAVYRVNTRDTVYTVDTHRLIEICHEQNHAISKHKES